MLKWLVRRHSQWRTRSGYWCLMGLNETEFLTYLKSCCIGRFSFSCRNSEEISLRKFYKASWCVWPCKTHQRVACPLSAPANEFLVRLYCLTAKISLSWALFYLLSSRRASEAIKPNKLGLRSKHRTIQHVWLPWYVGEQLDLIFRYVGCLLSDLALSSVLAENSSLFGKLKEEKKWFLFSTTGKIPYHLYL